jgi:hypothetical protein
MFHMKNPTVYKCTLGFDGKINPEGKPFIIEINGCNSGIAGLETLTQQSILEIRRRIQRDLVGDHPKTKMSFSLVSSAEQPNPDIKAPFYYRAAFNSPPPATVVSDIHGEECTYEVQYSPDRLEEVASNKLVQKPYIDEQFRAPFWVWDGTDEGLSDFIESLSITWADAAAFPFVVAKNVRGIRGENVRIFRTYDTEQISSFLRQYCPERNDAIVEGFVPSKEIEGYEDGCMRYLIDFVVYRDEHGRTAWKKAYEGAYWRISPGDNECSDGDLDRRFRANLCGEHPAQPLPVSEEDFAVMRTAVEHTVKNVVRDISLFSEN